MKELQTVHEFGVSNEGRKERSVEKFFGQEIRTRLKKIGFKSPEECKHWPFGKELLLIVYEL